nr:MAG TPA: Protein of unknown function (DUF1642) [Caudoviricetes sp.]
MNKQELIEGIEAIPAHNTRTRHWIDKKIVLGLIRQLDEPQKVVVPQFVADWIEECKVKGIALGYALYCSKKASDKKTYGWVVKSLDNQETFARAWLDGYEVEKEKRYLVKFKGLGHEFRVLKYNIFYKDWFTGSVREDSSFRIHHTRKQLEEAGFGWVFDCEGIEVKEVE